MTAAQAALESSHFLETALRRRAWSSLCGGDTGTEALVSVGGLTVHIATQHARMRVVHERSPCDACSPQKKKAPRARGPSPQQNQQPRRRASTSAKHGGMKLFGRSKGTIYSRVLAKVRPLESARGSFCVDSVEPVWSHLVPKRPPATTDTMTRPDDMLTAKELCNVAAIMPRAAQPPEAKYARVEVSE